jgi:hypothetical protein
MKVEKVDVSRVKDKLAGLKKKPEDAPIKSFGNFL